VQGVYSHASPETGCTMRFGVFLPPQAKETLVPVLYWLSGLTCTEENFIVKAGAQRVAAELGSPSSRRTPARAATTCPTTRRATTSARAPASTSTPRRLPGASTTACIPT
jgi:hypothetical protein